MAKKPQPLTSFEYANLKPGETAVFLDFDGTLADFAENPDAVSVPLPTRDVLARLEDSTGGALAIITGRPIQEIDRFLAPLHLPVAGVHGLERRNAGGEHTATAVETGDFTTLKERLRPFTEANPGTLIETKAGSLALHYRRRPELEQESAAAVHDAVDGLSGLQILQGKMVIEIKSGKATKADAVSAFMGEPPFRGRLPLFAGDDVTDEDAFKAVAQHGGISIKIGSGATGALLRAETTDAFRNWLAVLADSFDKRHLTA